MNKKTVLVIGITFVVVSVVIATVLLLLPGSSEKKECKNLGSCIGEQFEEASVFTNLETLEGIEDEESHISNFTVSFLNAGIVGLAASESLIDTVTCSDNSVEITFSMPVDWTRIQTMFPESSVLAVDGVVFGRCSLNQATVNDVSSDSDISGFLLVHSVTLTDTNTVQVVGEGVSINYLFQERSIFYQPSMEGKDGERRKLGKLDVAKKLWKYSNPSAIFAITFDPTVDFDPEVVRDEWRLVGDKWWKYDPFVDFEILFNFELAMQLGVNFTLARGLSTKPIKGDVPMLKFTPIPYFGFTLPRIVVKVLRKILPKAPIEGALGLGFEMPFSYSLKSDALVEVSVSSGVKFSSGRSRYRWTLKGVPPLILPEIETLEDLPASATTLPLDYKLPDGKVQASLSLGGKPTFLVNTFGIMKAKLGWFTGLKIKAQPFLLQLAPPIINAEGSPLELNCEDCHGNEFNIDVVGIGDPFVKFEIFLKRLREYALNITGISLTVPAFKICSNLEEEQTCGDQCCDTEDCKIDADGKGTCDALLPIISPTERPGSSPSPFPSESPVRYPSTPPSKSPILSPSTKPTSNPTISLPPTTTITISLPPSQAPNTSVPPSQAPTVSVPPSQAPTTSFPPSQAPTTSASPSQAPTESTMPSMVPTVSVAPSQAPTRSVSPSSEPSMSAIPTHIVVHEEAFCFCEAWGGFVDSTDGVCKVRPKTEMLGNGHCLDQNGNQYDYKVSHTKSHWEGWTLESNCIGGCATGFGLDFLRGCEYSPQDIYKIVCLYDNDATLPPSRLSLGENDSFLGTGNVFGTDNSDGTQCVRVLPADGNCSERAGDKCYVGGADTQGNCEYQKIQCADETEVCDPLDGICKVRPKFESTGLFGSYRVPVEICNSPDYKQYAFITIRTAYNKQDMDECLHTCLRHDNSFLVGASVWRSACICHFENGELPDVELTGYNDGTHQGRGGSGRPRCGGIHPDPTRLLGCFRINRGPLSPNAPLYRTPQVPEVPDEQWIYWNQGGRPWN